MSKIVQSEIRETSQNMQSLCKFFEEVERSIKQYHVLATMLQGECAQSCKRMFETQLTALQEFSAKSDLDKRSNGTMQKAMNQYFDTMANMVSVQSQALTSMMESCRQNVKMCSENWSRFAEHGLKILPSWNSEK